MNSKEKIKNIKSVINEFYHTEKCEGRLTECANDCWKSYQKDCDEIKQDLDRLEQLEKENQELKEHSTELFDRCALLTLKVEQLKQENQNLKEVMKNREEVAIELIKAITILKLVSSLNCDKTLETERHFLRLTQEAYELLKRVFESVGGENAKD